MNALAMSEPSMHQRIVIAAGTAVLIGAIGTPGRLALADPLFEARSHLVSSRAVATNYSITLAEYQALAEAATKKYGPGAKTTLHTNTGKVETVVDGKVVATEFVKARVQEVFGIFGVGRRSSQLARFPFMLRVAGTRGQRREDVGKTVRNRFEKQAPQLFGFTDLDWATLWCWSQDAPDAGAQFADAPPKLGKADLCLVRWRLQEPKTMLIGAVAADGGDWVRDASRPICRGLATQWLDMPGRSEPDYPVDYVACVLVHDPDRGTKGAKDTVVEHFYEVRPDRSLAHFN
jgi:hypothetical protein